MEKSKKNLRMNTLSRRKSPIALPFNKIHSPNTFKNHHRQKRSMKAGRKNLEAGDQLVQKHRSSYGAFRKRDEKLGIKKTSSCGEVTTVNGTSPMINSSNTGDSSSIISKKIRKKKPSLLQKAEKTVKRLEIEVAETRGYTKCMKELATNEATVLGIAVEAKVNQMKRMNIILSSKNQIINRFVTGMLAVFEAEDQLANLIP